MTKPEAEAKSLTIESVDHHYDENDLPEPIGFPEADDISIRPPYQLYTRPDDPQQLFGWIYAVHHYLTLIQPQITARTALMITYDHLNPRDKAQCTPKQFRNYYHVLEHLVDQYNRNKLPTPPLQRPGVLYMIGLTIGLLILAFFGISVYYVYPVVANLIYPALFLNNSLGNVGSTVGSVGSSLGTLSSLGQLIQ